LPIPKGVGQSRRRVFGYSEISLDASVVGKAVREFRISIFEAKGS
jgi:hypothetical protein